MRCSQENQLQFREWLVVNEGLWDAAVAGWRAFKQELNKPEARAFESQIKKIGSATDALFAVDRFYKLIVPTVDEQTGKKLEAKLEAAVQRIGYRLHPKEIFNLNPGLPKT